MAKATIGHHFKHIKRAVGRAAGDQLGGQVSLRQGLLAKLGHHEPGLTGPDPLDRPGIPGGVDYDDLRLGLSAQQLESIVPSGDEGRIIKNVNWICKF